MIHLTHKRFRPYKEFHHPHFQLLSSKDPLCKDYTLRLFSNLMWKCKIQQDKAQEHPGSWWTDWSTWLKAQAGKQVAAPKRYGKGTSYKVIEAAPGSYVKAKA